ncbi:MAG: hypothetical protein K6E29_03650 [Cyanobacteria bacterium RUI128]|nr:hypothetical protein [Cyanobacteria bacterium RUI128]
MKKFLVCFLLFCLGFNSGVFAENAAFNVDADFSLVSTADYKQKRVRKTYNVYNVVIRNNGTLPILLSSDSEIFFVLKNGSVIKSETRRQLYRKLRKADKGTYYTLASFGKLLSNIITYSTFGTFMSAGVGIHMALAAPTEMAIKNNVKISKELFYENPLPVFFDRESQYYITVFVPKEYDLEEIVISNVSLDMNEMYELRVRAKE